MKKINTIQSIYTCGAMAIVRVDTIERAYEIAQGCIDGGINVLEISFTCPNASMIIQALKQRFENQLIVGAGTILDSETARIAILSGAEFIIAPNFSEAVARTCNRYLIPYAPGCSTISEAMQALEIGASFIKAFPISDFYGSKLVSIFKTPIPDMPLLASGSITLDNLAKYMEAGVECCGFGSLLTKGTQAEISEQAKAIQHIIKTCRN